MSTNLDIILYLLILTCLVFSALLSGSETAITSIPREKIHQLDDTKKNKRIKRAKDQIEKTIGGILVANNFVNILSHSITKLNKLLKNKDIDVTIISSSPKIYTKNLNIKRSDIINPPLESFPLKSRREISILENSCSTILF